MKNNNNGKFMLRTDEYVSRISAYYDQLNEVGRRIADYLIKNNDVLSESITIGELSALTGASTSSIVRFCKTLGFKGFAEFKFFAQKGLFTQSVNSIRMDPDDNAASIKQKVAESAKNAINDCILTTDNRSLEDAIDALVSAKRVLICGQGSACGVAHSSANMFLSIGINAISVADPLTHIRIASYLDENDVVVGISNCGHIKDVVDTLMAARKAGATTICITGIVDSLVTKYADIVLYTTPHQNIHALDLPTTNICQIITIHTLLIGVLLRTQDRNAEHVKNLQNISQLKRYCLDLDEIDVDRVTFKKYFHKKT